MYTSADMKILQLIRLHLKIVAYFLRKNKLYERITGELLGFTMRNEHKHIERFSKLH